jgi:hypothetical protein
MRRAFSTVGLGALCLMIWGTPGRVSAQYYGGMPSGGTPAPKCPKSCNQLFATKLRACKRACPKGKAGKACKQACKGAKISSTASCKAATNPTPADCGGTTTSTTIATGSTATLTLEDYLSWCSVSVNGGPPSMAMSQTLMFPLNTVVGLSGERASSTFVFGYWVGTAGDTGPSHDTAMATMVTMDRDRTVQACCPFASSPNTPCPPP